MVVPIQLNKLSSGKDKDAALEYLQLLQEYQAIDVCNTLLAAVEAEQLSPLVFAVFLRATKSIQCIVSCLHQSFSIIIRKEAIKQYGKALKDIKRWKEAWSYLGNTDGILKYLSTVSVGEVKYFCKVVGECNYGQTRSEQRSSAVEQLLKAMNTSLFSDAHTTTSDERPLGICANRMVPACSADFVQELISENVKNPIYAACSKPTLIKAFKYIVRDYTKSVIFTIKAPDFPPDVRIFLSEFVRNEPMLPGKEKHFSASMEFSEKLLEERIRHPDTTWPHKPTESGIYLALLKRCLKKRVSKKRLHGVIDLGLRLIKTKPKLKTEFSTDGVKFWSIITGHWVKWPGYWEDLLIKGLKLGLAGKGWIPDKFKTFINSVEIKPETSRPDRLWSALRLFCLYARDKGFDIDTAERFDIDNQSNFKWDFYIFQQLSNDKAIRLLKLLLRGFPNWDFLLCNEYGSLLQVPVSLRAGGRNREAWLYLTQLQIDSPEDSQQREGRERATETYSDLKNKCLASKEQPERAQLAKAMGLYAIASGSLALYGEYVTWIARFIRDPLTAKVLFASDVTTNKDVCDLLSAIPSQITKLTKLSDISKNVSQANAILSRFTEHRKTAKREPSYQSHEWNAVDQLIAESIRIRIDRAKSLQKHLSTTQGELYTQIWSQTFAMYSQSGASSMNKASSSMSSLLTDLPPKLLLTVTESMLEIDSQYRTSKAGGKEAEDESNVISSLVNNCLLALAHGDNPTIAGELIVRFIIDRPDASSWHRQMLKPGFLNRLPAEHARQLLLTFSKVIGEKLEEQSYVRIGEGTTGPAIIKVTTVKYLAQILQDAEFLSAEDSIDVLLELFKVATHPDIRIATLESMLSALDKLAAPELAGPTVDISKSQNPLVQKILAALDAVVPVIGSMNERRPPTEQEWRAAEEDPSLLPAPSEGVDDRPIWGKLVRTATISKSLKGYFVKRLLLPGLEISILTHRKWMDLFLKKHGAGFSVDRLPKVIPASPFMMTTMIINFLEYIPKELLNGWNEYTKFLLERPTFLHTFNTKLESDEKMSFKPDITQFRSMTGHRTSSSLGHGVNNLISLLQREWKPSLLPGNTGVSVEQIQKAILDQIAIVLLRYDEEVKEWGYLQEKFRHPSTDKEWQEWKKHCQPLLGNIVTMVESLRTPRWTADPNRKPSILPSTTKQKLWMLDWPIPGISTETADARIVKSGRQMVDLISSLSNSKWSPTKAEHLTADVMTVSDKINDRERIQLGVILGVYNRLDSIEESIRVSLAIKFFNKGQPALKDKSLKSDVATVFGHWQKSSTEEVREMVLYLRDEHQHNSLWKTVFSKD